MSITIILCACTLLAAPDLKLPRKQGAALAADDPILAVEPSPILADASRDALPMSRTVGFLPRGLTSFGAAVSGGWLYVLGGYFGEPHAYSREGQSSAFFRMNLLDTRDLRLLSDIEPVQGAELVAWGQRLIRVGGMHALNPEGNDSRLVSSSKVEVFDTLTEAWEELPCMPSPRSSHRAVVLGDSLFVLGGWLLKPDGEEPQWADSYLRLDLADSSAEWIEGEAPFLARAMGAAAVDGHLVAVGGIGADRRVSSAAWLLNAESLEWEEGPTFPDWGFGMSATNLGGRVAASGKSGDVYLLSQDRKEWLRAGELTHGRIFHELVQGAGESLLALGGIVGMGTRGRVRNVEELELGTTVPSGEIERAVIPSPHPARNRFGLFLQGRSLFLFGGNNSLGQHDFAPDNFVDEAWRLDLGSLTWTQLTPTQARRQTMQTAVIEDGAIGVSVGGFGHSGDDAVTQGTSWLYDFEFGDWSKGPDLAGTRSQFGLAEHRGSLWIFGGLDYDPSRDQGLQFDHRLEVLEWRMSSGAEGRFEVTGIELPEPRRAFAGAMHGGRYYMVGGMGESFRRVESTVAFEFEAGRWLELPSPGRSRVGADLIALGEDLFLVGGSSPRQGGKGLESNRSVERFSTSEQRWTVEIEDIGFETKHARAFSVDGRIYVVSMHRAGTPRLEMCSFAPR